ncbi:MoaD/ThiS family protein [Sulfobacillus harzensis]|uniref:MoaD/ThiS family protein n=1 Tax=Sulfobacillus harzensis TaxID=2729629 RepID=A0A7Y0Q3A5_9FIRM|nr:MoaD/ThiS family protein [Sulfobacillus harzensis]NMP23357.1 MoaD/ThiS family protein [Sulfobacillus harzensis]
MVTVHLPDDLASEFGAKPTLSLSVHNLGELFAALESRHPGMATWLSEADGQIRPNLSIFVAGSRLPNGAGPESPIPHGSEVWILRAISGG